MAAFSSGNSGRGIGDNYPILSYTETPASVAKGNLHAEEDQAAQTAQAVQPRSSPAPAAPAVSPAMDFNHIVYAVYVAVLIATCFAVSGLWGRLLASPPKQRTAIVLACNWVLNTLYVISTGITDPWWWFVLTDATSARIVLHQPAGKAQATVGWVYMAQILMHVVYAASDRAIAAIPYWQVLISLAFVQVIVLGGWHIGGRGVLARYWRRRDSAVALAPRDEGVAE